MELEDIPAVMEVERQSFTMPWPSHAYRRELKENRLARYVVARRTGPAVESDLALGEVESRATPPPPSSGWMGLLRRIAGALGSPAPTPSRADSRSRRVVGYAGLWLMVDEAHVTAIAVSPAYRGLGAGELLMLALVDIAREIGAQYLTLEVRVSNNLAQSLYRKFGFKETGVRRKYYSDNNEDALIMWSDPLESPGFRQMVAENRRILLERLKSPRIRADLQTRTTHP